MNAVHVIVPDGIDDPARTSGGNTYDRRLCNGLRSLGWTVHEHAVTGDWPRPDAASFAALASALDGVPDYSVVLLDGLVASTAPHVLLPASQRLRLVVLIHMPFGDRPAGEHARRREGAVACAAAAIVTTSAWARRRLLELYPLSSAGVHVASPGVDAADLASGSAGGEALLCVATVSAVKGHDLLLDALETLLDLSWQCLCVGDLERERPFVEGLRGRLGTGQLRDRVDFVGTRNGADLDRSYIAADLLVLSSRAETYGMVITEALARGLPVVAAGVGGVAEALGVVAPGVRPGLLVEPDDPAALAGALRTWLGDAELRGRLRAAARERRTSLAGWSTTTALVADVLAKASR